MDYIFQVNNMEAIFRIEYGLYIKMTFMMFFLNQSLVLQNCVLFYFKDMYIFYLTISEK